MFLRRLTVSAGMDITAFTPCRCDGEKLANAHQPLGCGDPPLACSGQDGARPTLYRQWQLRNTSHRRGWGLQHPCGRRTTGLRLDRDGGDRRTAGTGQFFCSRPGGQRHLTGNSLPGVCHDRRCHLFSSAFRMPTTTSGRTPAAPLSQRFESSIPDPERT